MDIEINSVSINDFVLKNINAHAITFFIILFSIILIQNIISQWIFFYKQFKYRYQDQNRAYLDPDNNHY